MRRDPEGQHVLLDLTHELGHFGNRGLKPDLGSFAVRISPVQLRKRRSGHAGESSPSARRHPGEYLAPRLGFRREQALGARPRLRLTHDKLAR